MATTCKLIAKNVLESDATTVTFSSIPAAFDDLLIGNFMKTTLHGDWWGKQGTDALYPHFTPFVTKFGDNGGACDAAALRAYFAEYFRRGYTEFTADRSEQEMRAALAPYLG